MRAPRFAARDQTERSRLIALLQRTRPILLLLFLTPAFAAAAGLPPEPDALPAAYKRLQAALQAQVQADEQQRNAARSLQMADRETAQVLELQQSATAAQQEANQVITALNNLHERTQKARREAEQGLTWVTQTISRLDKAQQALPGAEAEEEKLQEELAGLRQQLERAPEELGDLPAKERQPRIQGIRNKVRKTEQRLRDAAGKVRQHQRVLDESRLDQHQKYYREHLEQLAEFSAQYVRLQEEAGLKQATAREAQAVAYQALLELLETEEEQPSAQERKSQLADADAAGETEQTEQDVAQAQEQPAPAVASADSAQTAGDDGKAGEPGDAADGSAETSTPDVAGARASAPMVAGSSSAGGSGSRPAPLSSPVAVLSSAHSVEGRISERYRGIRAADLALAREIPLSEALASTDVPLPGREALDDGVLSSPPRTSSQLEQYSAEMQKAVTQLDSMVQFGEQLLTAARPAMADESGGAPEEGMTVQRPSSSSGSGPSSDVARALETASTDQADARAIDLTGLMRAGYSRFNPYEEDDLLGRPIRRGYIPPGMIEDTKAMMAAAPGRRIGGSTSGLPAHDWIYIDAWHVIGPFPNQDRRNKDRQFPPETVIDLDATYEGEAGQPVRWRFVQGGSPVFRFSDSYVIYYAYTEIWSDQEQEMWIAVGADDAARLWINDMLVWKSVDTLKPWRIDEGYRKVVFRRGLNRILYRIENGPVHGWWSLLLHTAPVLSPAEERARQRAEG